MAIEHVIEQGECIATLAERHGHRMATLWDHPRNAELKALRGNPYVLHIGDVVFVPDIRKRVEVCPTDARHRFRRHDVPEKFRLQLLDDDEPIKNTPYVFEIGKDRREHQTTAQGWVEEWVPPSATKATLTFVPPRDPADPKDLVIEPLIYEILLGALAPPDTESGARARLLALSYLEEEGAQGPPDTEDQDEYRLALATLQSEHELDITGELDPPTVELLRELYGS